LCVVEDRRENHRQRFRRTIAELEEQKRILKNQLEQRIHVWSENLKKPNFIRTRDKISFSIGVANACFSPLIGIKNLLSLIKSIVLYEFSWTLAAYVTSCLYNSSFIPYHTSIFYL
jgi:hypothetical protein